MLEAGGFSVVGEASGVAEADAAVRRLGPQVVLLDLQLAGEDGLALAARLAADPDAPRVVLTSTRDPGDYGTRLTESGALGFIPKAELSGEALDALLRVR